MGQSIWLDYIRRAIIESGELSRLIEENGITGITSNPSIFEKAIAGSDDYDGQIRELSLQGKDAKQIYKELTVQDIKAAALLLRPAFEKAKGGDGFISLEVSPYLARDTEGTLREARELWQSVDCPNLMIKVPGTIEGIPAIKQLISEGINVNVTLLFSVSRYGKIADAYLSGLEARSQKGLRIDNVASVASFFLSRIDVLVDPLLEKVLTQNSAQATLARSLQGHVAIDSAKAAYQVFNDLIGTERFRILQSKGARPQRLLWASTGTKNPQYSDILYIESLIGPNTVNTVPPETLTAYQDHGSPKKTLEHGSEGAAHRLESLGGLGIDLRAVTDQLEKDGIDKFQKPYDKLLASIETKRRGFEGH
jgi:transaldolase